MVLDGRADDLDLKAQVMSVSTLLTLHEVTVVLGPSPSDSPTTEYALTVTCIQRYSVKVRRFQREFINYRRIFSSFFRTINDQIWVMCARCAVDRCVRSTLVPGLSPPS